ncbi:MAG TPA: hypothetical protein VMZ91_15450 [Candidatus Paceibacterota bacterium]|nr:hypothetical protein [Candidatus Paceibacterota bacterium]
MEKRTFKTTQEMEEFIEKNLPTGKIIKQKFEGENMENITLTFEEIK